MLFIITLQCVIPLKHSLLHALSSQHLCKLQPKAAERQYEAGLVGCLMFSPAPVSLINSWLSSVTNVSLPSSSPEEEEFLMFSLFYGSMFAAGIAVCVWYTHFFSALFLLRFIRDRESKRLTAFVLLAWETQKEKKKKRREKRKANNPP